MSDRLAARLRTAWPYALAWLTSLVLVHGAPVAEWLRDVLGLEVTEPQVAAGLGVALGYAVYESGRWLESRQGNGRVARVARWVGRVLLSAGLHTGQPSYRQD